MAGLFKIQSQGCIGGWRRGSETLTPASLYHWANLAACQVGQDAFESEILICAHNRFRGGLMQAIFLSMASSHWKISGLEFEVERGQKFLL